MTDLNPNELHTNSAPNSGSTNVKPHTTHHTHYHSATHRSTHNSRKTNINSFFRNIGILTVFVLIFTSSVFAYILVNPKTNESKWFLENTGLTRYFSVINNQNNTDANGDTNKVVNNFFGLNTNQYPPFAFSKPGNGKPATEVVKEVLPSVVSISVRSVSGRLGSADITAGTGFFVREDGLLVTNKHVIARACQNPDNIRISAQTHDQKAYNLQLLSVDPIYDLAILKVDSQDKFQPVRFSDSTDLPLGTEVIAIGNVLGQLQNTVTKGIVSGTNRTITAPSSDPYIDECTGSRSSVLDNLIQTDAAINPGNSGGPLFDASGSLLAMNTLGSTQAQNIGLAISSNVIVSGLNSFQEKGTITRPRLGIFSQSITALDKQQNPWLPVDYGEIILSPDGREAAVGNDSAASKAGLVEGDIITEFNGVQLKATDVNPSPLRRLVLTRQEGDEVELTVLKAQNVTDTQFQYSSEPVKVRVVLGGTNYKLF